MSAGIPNIGSGPRAFYWQLASPWRNEWRGTQVIPIWVYCAFQPNLTHILVPVVLLPKDNGAVHCLCHDIIYTHMPMSAQPISNGILSTWKTKMKLFPTSMNFYKNGKKRIFAWTFKLTIISSQGWEKTSFCCYRNRAKPIIVVTCAALVIKWTIRSVFRHFHHSFVFVLTDYTDIYSNEKARNTAIFLESSPQRLEKAAIFKKYAGNFGFGFALYGNFLFENSRTSPKITHIKLFLT